MILKKVNLKTSKSAYSAAGRKCNYSWHTKKTKGPGTVTIAVNDLGDKVRISVKDTGAGISDEVIENLYRDDVPARQIGLYNVHQRVRLIYGKGLIIKRLSPGTEVYFDIERRKR
ncbi:hypothetical protein GCM10020331_020440 [Ectobacillus funiculus]